jgi:hypothetical protein
MAAMPAWTIERGSKVEILLVWNIPGICDFVWNIPGIYSRAEIVWNIPGICD